MIAGLTVTGGAVIVLAAGMAIVWWLIERGLTAQDNVFRYGLRVAAHPRADIIPRTGVVARADLVLASSASERDWARLTGPQCAIPAPAAAVYEMPHDDPALD